MKIRKKLKWIVLIISLLFFLIITIKVFHKPAIGIDNIFYKFISENIISDSVTPIVKMITRLGGATILISLTIMSLIFIRNKKIGLCIVVNLCLASLLNVIMKNILQRERPSGFRIIEESGYSFPSGHSMASMAFYGLIIFFIYKYVENKYIKSLAIFFFSILILLIGASRIYLGVHYTTDVLGGFLLSIVYLIIFTSASKKYILERVYHDK